MHFARSPGRMLVRRLPHRGEAHNTLWASPQIRLGWSLSRALSLTKLLNAELLAVRTDPINLFDHRPASSQILAEAEVRAAEEQRRCEAAKEQSRPNNLIEYLEACHSFSLALKVITDATLTTQGDTTKPAGRPFPQRIIPWNNFPAQQEKI